MIRIGAHQLACPACRKRLEIAPLLHHMVCAYVGPAYDFTTTGTGYACPKCRRHRVGRRQLRDRGNEYALHPLRHGEGAATVRSAGRRERVPAGLNRHSPARSRERTGTSGPRIDMIASEPARPVASIAQAAFKMPSCCRAVAPSSRPTSSAILPFFTRRTVVPVKRISGPTRREARR